MAQAICAFNAFIETLYGSSYLWIEMESVVWLKLLVASNEFIAMLYGLSYPVVARTWVFACLHVCTFVRLGVWTSTTSVCLYICI